MARSRISKIGSLASQLSSRREHLRNGCRSGCAEGGPQGSCGLDGFVVDAFFLGRAKYTRSNDRRQGAPRKAPGILPQNRSSAAQPVGALGWTVRRGVRLKCPVVFEKKRTIECLDQHLSGIRRIVPRPHLRRLRPSAANAPDPLEDIGSLRVAFQVTVDAIILYMCSSEAHAGRYFGDGEPCTLREIAVRGFRPKHLENFVTISYAGPPAGNTRWSSSETKNWSDPVGLI